MTLLGTAAVLITLAALFGYLNHRFIGAPSAIGMMFSAFLTALAVTLLDALGFHEVEAIAQRALANVDFNQVLMHGMLSFLLFAGALHINLDDLIEQRWAVGFLASLGVLISTALIGCALYWVFIAFGHHVPFAYCLVFGALISPTDPIAVLNILKSMGAEKHLEMKMAGESLFNDGVGVVVFVVLLGIATGEHAAEPVTVVGLFLREALGGALLGLAAGYAAFHLLRGLDHYPVEMMITLALVMGGYALANMLHVSGPIAMVVAGLLIGNRGRHLAMSERTREHLDTFWELIDEILNAVLFVLIGLEVLLLRLQTNYLWVAVLSIPVILAVRLAVVSLPRLVPGVRGEFSWNVIKVLTWGGLRGGISVALALSLPDVPERPPIVTVTYVVVVFSILVQGLTVSRVLQDKSGGSPNEGSDEAEVIGARRGRHGYCKERRRARR